MICVGGCTGKDGSKTVKSGLDVLVESNFNAISGKRVAVITNQTGIDSRGDHIADLIQRAPGVELVRLFSPEHGIRGTEEGGLQISDGIDAGTGVAVQSLYGDVRKPTSDMLEGIDALIFDIQDVGTRFYTYISTMSLAMEAAAEAGVEFILLDRPNPVGGAIVEGPVLEGKFRSFVGIHPIALRHGMTVAELAMMFNGEGWLAGGIKCDLAVIRLENWKRSLLFGDTGLPWVKPSPNMPSPTTALLYSGMGLLEATTISEGRGTTHPFENIGAPWIRQAEVIAHLSGPALKAITLDPVTFTPVDMWGAAMNPKYEGDSCHGFFLRVSDPRHYRSVEFGIYLISALKKLYPEQVLIRERGMNLLSGSEQVTKMLIAGEGPEMIINSWQHDLVRFIEMREKYLLY